MVDGLLLAVAVAIPLMAERLLNVLAERRVARPSAMAETGSS
jgi:hypothetical protein